MNVGALDLGSNSFGLLVGRARPDGRVEKLTSRKEQLRIGDVVAATGGLPEAAFERALTAVRELLDLARENDAERVAAVGTSALRDASNGADFARAALERCGVGIQIASGEEEGELVYRGARSALDNLPARVLVLDLGGGSAELAVGNGNELLAVESLPLGFLRVGRELGVGGTLNGAVAAAVAAHAASTAERALGRLTALSPEAIVLSGGTARTLARVAGALGAGELTPLGLRRLAAYLAGRDPSHLAVLGVDAARAPVFGVGVVVLASLVELIAGSSVKVSSGGLREGIVLRETRRRELASRRSSVRTWAA